MHYYMDDGSGGAWWWMFPTMLLALVAVAALRVARGHDDHAARFRDRLWWSLILSLPVVAFSSMFADLVGYTRPAGTGWVSPVFGRIVFAYGGTPFLRGAVAQRRARRPGMMLLRSRTASE